MARKKPGKRPQKVVKKAVRKKARKPALPPFKIDLSFWRKQWIPAVAIFLLGMGLYLQAINYDYILDDQIVITKNDYTNAGIAGIKDILTTESFQGYLKARRDLVAGARYRPLSIVTFALERDLVGPGNYSFSHFINALLYGLTGLLLFRILTICFPKEMDKPFYKSIPFWGGLLFALHPVHVEVVANIKGRDEVMALLGSLAAWYCTFRYFAGKKVYWLGLSFVTLFLAMMSKENALTFLAVIPFALWVFGKASKRDLLVSTIPLFLASLAYLIIRYQVIGYLSIDSEITDLMNNPFVEMSGSEKYATITYTLGKYIQLLFFPHPLSHDYYPYAIPIMQWINPLVLLSFVAYLIMGIAAVKSVFKPGVLGFASFYFIATLSIVSNILFPVGTFMNERFIYMPSVAFCIFLPYMLLKVFPEKWGETKKWVPTAGLVVLCLYAIGFTVKTIERIPVWKTPMSLNASAVKVSKNSARANVFMATALYNAQREVDDRDERKRMLSEASGYLNHALDIFPTYGNALKMQAGVEAELYKFNGDLEHLMSVFEEILRVRTNIGYVDEYLDYLRNRKTQPEIQKDFYYRVGYSYFGVEQPIPGLALKYILKGLELDQSDRRLNWAASQIYQRIGKQQEAARHKSLSHGYQPQG